MTLAELNRQIRLGKLPRYVFARGKDLKLERYPDKVRGTKTDFEGKTVTLKKRGKLTWRMIDVASAIDLERDERG